MDTAALLRSALLYVPYVLAIGGTGLAIWWRFELSECRRESAAEFAAAGKAAALKLQQALQDAQRQRKEAEDAATAWWSREVERVQGPDLQRTQQIVQAQAAAQRAQDHAAQLQASLAQQAEIIDCLQRRLRNAVATAERFRNKVAKLTGQEPHLSPSRRPEVCSGSPPAPGQ